MDWVLKQAKTAINLLEAAGFEAYLVGGCVRDSLLEVVPKDYDLTTNAKPEEMIRVFSAYRVIETGLRHGTITVIVDGASLEITTYRIESAYSDCRHPDRVEFTQSLEKDLTRRDFTMNAIAYHPTKGYLDFFKGKSDIQQKTIRCVGNPDTRVQEDALRILRALRFASELGFSIDTETERALFRNRAGLQEIAVERISIELNKLLVGKNVKKVLLRYIDILGEVIPELLPMKGVQQRSQYHIYDVLTHTAVALEHVLPDKLLRWAVLLHDIGKSASFTMDEQGMDHYDEHHKLSGQLADRVLRRLKFDRATKERIVMLVNYHDVPIKVERINVRRLLNRLTPPVFFDLLQVKRADLMGQAVEYHYQLKLYNQLEYMAHQVLEEDCIALKDLAVDGRDLIKDGYQGREIGARLQFLLEAVLDGKVENDKIALLKYDKNK